MGDAAHGRWDGRAQWWRAVFDDIWIAIDGADRAQHAVALAAALAASERGLSVVHARTAADEAFNATDRIAVELLSASPVARASQQVAGLAAAQGVPIRQELTVGYPTTPAMIALLREFHPDLLVVGIDGPRRLGLLPALSRALLRSAPCPIALVIDPSPRMVGA